MASTYKTIWHGIRIFPGSSASSTRKGDMSVDDTANKLFFHNGTDASAALTENHTASVKNKTLDNTNTITVKDANFTIQDDGDATKQAKFQASGITAGQTRTFTLPDASTTVVGTDTTQTLTSKTIVAANNTITTASSGNLAATELNAALAELQTDIDTRSTSTDLTNHINDASDAHDASAISFSPAGSISSTDVQAAIAEVDSDVTAHVGDSSAAHAASAISFSATGNIASTDVQAAIAELDSEKAASSHTHSAADVTSGTLAIARGGTNISTYTQGDILYASAADTLAKLAKGTSGQFLKIGSTIPEWADVSAQSVTSKTTTYTATVSDDLILCNSSGGAFTVTLYAASGNSGKILKIKKTDSSVNAVTIDGNASETIDGALTTTLSTQYEIITIICDGSNWHLVDREYDRSWQSYTPTGDLVSNATYTGFWRRVGDTAEYHVNIAFSNTTDSVAFTLDQPIGHTIDTAKMPYTTAQHGVLGIINWYDGSTNSFFGNVVYSSTTEVKARGLLPSSANDHYWRPASEATSVPVGMTTGRSIQLRYSVPISGWK